MKKRSFPYTAVTWAITLVPPLVYAVLCAVARDAIVARHITTTDAVFSMLLRSTIGVLVAALMSGLGFVCVRLISEDASERDREEFIASFKGLTLALTALFTVFAVFLVLKGIVL